MKITISLSNAEVGKIKSAIALIDGEIPEMKKRDLSEFKAGTAAYEFDNEGNFSTSLDLKREFIFDVIDSINDMGLVVKGCFGMVKGMIPSIAKRFEKWAEPLYKETQLAKAYLKEHPEEDVIFMSYRFKIEEDRFVWHIEKIDKTADIADLARQIRRYPRCCVAAWIDKDNDKSFEIRDLEKIDSEKELMTELDPLIGCISYAAHKKGKREADPKVSDEENIEISDEDRFDEYFDEDELSRAFNDEQLEQLVNDRELERLLND